MPSLGVIVEGESEEISIPLLLRRIMYERLNVYDIPVTRPFRVKRGKIVKEGEIERTIIQLMRDRDEVGGILVVFDADGDCPVGHARNMLEWGSRVT